MNNNENENRETVADIVAEMQYRGKCPDPIAVMRLGELAQYADRIEAAWKRQEQCYLDQIRDAINMIGHERFVKEHPPVGNAAAKKHRRTKADDPSEILHDFWRDHYEV